MVLEMMTMLFSFSFFFPREIRVRIVIPKIFIGSLHLCTASKSDYFGMYLLSGIGSFPIHSLWR